MAKKRDRSRGFTLIAALLLTVLLSGLAVGLLYMVSNEARMGGNDLEANMSFYAAEAGIENETALLSQLYQTSQTPTAANIQTITNAANFPTNVAGSNITNVTYVEPPITWPYSDANGNPKGTWDIVGAGPNQGMVATVIPFNLTVTAIRNSASGQVSVNSTMAASGASTTMSRTVEVAELPAFEFGIFCDGDCDYFAGPNFNFGGRVHTNNNLFLASGSALTFTDKIAAVGQVILDQLENGHPTSSGYTGSVYLPSAAGGCPPAPAAGPATFCTQLNQGSWTGGYPIANGSANSSWKTYSIANFNSFILNGLTGAKKLQLPFVQSSTLPPTTAAIDILRRPQVSDSALLTTSRLFTKAEIRIMLADDIKDLHPYAAVAGGAGGVGVFDADDVQLVLPAAGGYRQLTQGPGAGSYMYFATGTNGVNGWATPTVAGCSSPWPLHGGTGWAATTKCQGAWLRIEYKDAADTWHGVTREWLGYGFGRFYNMPPTAPWQTAGTVACGFLTAAPKITTSGGVSQLNLTGYPAVTTQCYNPISPAILILQQLQVNKAASAAYEADTTNTSNTAGNWIPINFYDSREGEPRDNGARNSNYATSTSGTTYTPCSPSGVMNAVELDVGNLWLWLQHAGGGPYSTGHGNLVNNSDQGGYIVYFSDHRGMQQDNHTPYNTFYNKFSGASGLEDIVNSSSSTGVQDNVLENSVYYTFSPEDANDDGFLDNQGETVLGAGFNLSSTYYANPYFPIPANAVNSNANQVNCNSSSYSGGTATTTVYNGAGNPQNNMVTGPRHALRLVDGGMKGTTTYLPNAGSTTSYGNGFSVVSEEPVYILGDYNSGISDPFWPSENSPAGALHSASAIISDAVTLLSNPPSSLNLPNTYTGWMDATSFLNPGRVAPSCSTCTDGRNANTSYYRVAIAAGKTIPFPQPGWAGQDFGTDGGMHNFLRYLENRGYNGATVNYAGSLISMYYSQYATGNFKCCNVVYGAPQRNYFFDTQFLNPNNLPPGTPMFQDVVSLSYHESFTPQ
jgi:Tfp pilus assembly protein PilX